MGGKTETSGAEAHERSTKPRCDALLNGSLTRGTGRRCRKYAGQDTEHPGVGRCALHGGKSLPGGPTHPRYKHGLYGKVTVQNIGELVRDLADDRDIYDMTQEIRILEALAMNALNGGATGQAASLLMQVTRAKERLHNVAVGKKVLINIEEVHKAIEAVVLIIQTRVKDKETLELIAADLSKIAITNVREKRAALIEATEEDDD